VVKWTMKTIRSLKSRSEPISINFKEANLPIVKWTIKAIRSLKSDSETILRDSDHGSHSPI
jgi:hypothetical protein